MDQKKNYILAIESAIAGGSLALLDHEHVISSRFGDGSVSRAEDLLPNIASMLEEAGISKDQLSRVAVSLGPGSYTGLRIGISTAMGLKRGLDIEYVGVPLFEALSEAHSDTLIAVPMGKTDICFVDSALPGEQRVVDQAAFQEIIQRNQSRNIIIHPALSKRLVSVENIEFLDPNLASCIGRAAVTLPPSEKLEPIYVQNPRFG